MTEAELLQALAEAHTLGGEGSTALEMAEMLGCGRGKVLTLLKRAIREGKVRVTRKQIVNISGRVQTVASYVAC